MDLSIIGLAVGLALDAFAVSVAGGAVVKEHKVRHAVRMALFFGGFQAVMPLVGWLAGSGLRQHIVGVSHWVAFGLLTVVGGRMLVEAFRLEPGERKTAQFDASSLLLLSIATSVDALAVGVTLGLLHEAIIIPVVVIGAVTFVLSLAGVYVGDRLGHVFEGKVEIAAGLILIGIGLRILLTHSV